MSYNLRYNVLLEMFTPDKEVVVPDSGVRVRFYPFHSEMPHNGYLDKNDLQIRENKEFTYPVFFPDSTDRYNNAILMLHGLNERNWNKYLTWAEFLCLSTGKPVILFPIAFHINRSPVSWSNPRFLKPLLDIRKKQTDNDRSLSFANLALSERICENPFRFYNSGRQSLNDISTLIFQIKNGEHNLFTENAGIDVFAYSIGAFLSQIAFMSDRNDLLKDSKLFMFCGGSIFSSMLGESRSIMDKTAFEKLYQFYKNEFSGEDENASFKDEALDAFLNMISPERNTEKRETFFNKMGNRLKGISLLNDKVIPYSGVVCAIGKKCATDRIQLLDFPHRYEHEQPFPVLSDNNCELVNRSFSKVFNTAASFLA
jgi:hypothetical protein